MLGHSELLNEWELRFKHDVDSAPEQLLSMRLLRPRKRQIDYAESTYAAEQTVTDARRRRSQKSTSNKSHQKKCRINRGYAPPSRYAHLKPVPDALAAGLLLVVVGLNPGVATAKAGHAFAGPTNIFWMLMRESGVVPCARPLRPSDDQTLPALWRVGLTNLCSRPTAEQTELSRTELVEGVAVLEGKLRPLQPEVVCISGKGIYDAIWRARYGRPLPKDSFKFGFQPSSERFAADPNADWPGSRLFVAPSTSGRVAFYSREYRLEVWKELGNWISKRRAESDEKINIKSINTTLDISTDTAVSVSIDTDFERRVKFDTTADFDSIVNEVSRTISVKSEME